MPSRSLALCSPGSPRLAAIATLAVMASLAACRGEEDPAAEASPTPEPVGAPSGAAPAGPQESPDDAAPRATVVELLGEATQGGRALTQGAVIGLAEPVVVKRGRLVLDVDGVGTVRLFSDTRMAMGSRTRLRLFLGRVWSTITADHFEVETDNAVAGVRGTDFVVTAQGSDSEVGVLEGEVEVDNPATPKKGRRVRAGQKTQVKKRQPPGRPQKFDGKRFKKLWSDLAGLITEGAKRAGEAAKGARDDLDKALEGDDAKSGGRAVKKGARRINDSVKKGLKNLLK